MSSIWLCNHPHAVDDATFSQPEIRTSYQKKAPTTNLAYAFVLCYSLAKPATSNIFASLVLGVKTVFIWTISPSIIRFKKNHYIEMESVI